MTQFINRNVFEPFDPAIREFADRRGWKLWVAIRDWDIRYLNPDPEVRGTGIFFSKPDPDNTITFAAVDPDHYLRQEFRATPETLGEALEKAYAVYQQAISVPMAEAARRATEAYLRGMKQQRES